MSSLIALMVDQVRCRLYSYHGTSLIPRLLFVGWKKSLVHTVCA